MRPFIHSANRSKGRLITTPALTSTLPEEFYILTLHTDAAHNAAITALRTHYSPTHAKKLSSAHLALFRALPGSHIKTIESDILAICQRQQAFSISTGEPFLLFRGVGLHVEATPAIDIYTTLRAKWEGFLTKQDKTFRAHYTIQNKVRAKESKKTMQELQQRFKGSRGEVDRLALWRYGRGYFHTEYFDLLGPQRLRLESIE